MFVAQKMVLANLIVELIDIYGRCPSHILTINDTLVNIKYYGKKCQFSNKDT